jgi:hypothetical protein
VNVAGVALGRLRLARGTLLRSRSAAGGRARHPLLALALGLTLGGLMFGGAHALFRWLAQGGAGAEAAAGPLGLLFAAGLGGLLVFDVQEAVAVLLLDSDLELLRRAPLGPRQILALKLADALGRTAIPIVVFLLPAPLAFAAVYRLPAWGWAIVPLGLAALWAIPLGLGVAITLLFMSRVPVRRAREGLAHLSTIVLLLLWFANAFLLPRLMRSDAPAPDLMARLEPAERLGSLLPSGWAARALAAAAQDRPAEAATAALTLALAGGLALALAAWSASAGLENAQARAAAPAGARASGRRGSLARRRRAGAASAILRRDARLLLREWTVLSDVLVSAALWTLFPLLALSHRNAAGPLMARAMLVTLAVALGYEVAARSLPFEREAGAWRQLAPVPPRRWAAAKLAGAAAIAAPILLAASVAVALAFALTAAEGLRVMALALPALGLALAIGLWSGATFGNPRWTDPRAMLGLAGRLVALVLLAVQVAFWIAAGLIALRLGAALAPGLELYGPVALGALVAVVPFGFAVRRLARMEWPG